MRGSLIALVGLLLLTACSSGARPEIVGQSAIDSGALFGDATVHVECEIRNTGDTGNVIVTASLDARNGAWTKRKISVMIGGETRAFTFDFPGVEYQLFNDGSLEYQCGLE